MSLIQSTVVDTIRHGVPVTGAILGAVTANKRIQSPTLVKLGLYTLGGWAAGYAVRMIVLEGLAGIFRKPLPQNVAAIRSKSSPPVAPGLAGTNPPKNPPVAQGPSPSDPTLPDKSNNVDVKGTLFSDAYGAL